MCKTDCGIYYKFDGKEYDSGLGTPRRCVEDCYEVTTANLTISIIEQHSYQYRMDDPLDGDLKKCVYAKDCPADKPIADPFSRDCVAYCPAGWY